MKSTYIKHKMKDSLTKKQCYVNKQRNIYSVFKQNILNWHNNVFFIKLILLLFFTLLLILFYLIWL